MNCKLGEMTNTNIYDWIQFIKILLKRRKVLLPKWENEEKREIPVETRGSDQVPNKSLPSVLGLP